MAWLTSSAGVGAVRKETSSVVSTLDEEPSQPARTVAARMRGMARLRLILAVSIVWFPVVRRPSPCRLADRNTRGQCEWAAEHSIVRRPHNVYFFLHLHADFHECPA